MFKLFSTFFNRTGLSRRLGSARKLLFSYYRHSNRASQRGSKEMPTVKWGPRQGHIGHRKSVHLWSSSQAEHNHIVWSTARTPPKGRHEVLLGRLHSAGRLHCMGCYRTKPYWWEMWSHDRLWTKRRNDIRCNFPAAFHPSTAPCHTLSERSQPCQIYLEIRSARFRIFLSSLNIKLGIITFQSILNNCISEFRRSVLYKVLIYNKLRRSFV